MGLTGKLRILGLEVVVVVFVVVVLVRRMVLLLLELLAGESELT
jgi:hypothetical protein